MDPLTLLRELYGEEPVRKIVTSGFDSVEKIASATPDSLSFFAGLSETLARQIVESAAELRAAPQAAGYRGALAASTAAEGAGRTPVPPVKLKVPETAPAQAHAGEPRGRTRSRPLDAHPILDAGGILKTMTAAARPKGALEGDLLEEIGITDAEADFLEGGSPWSPAPLGSDLMQAPVEAPEAPSDPDAGSPVEMEPAPISDWSPERDPDPVPRLVRAPELGGDAAVGDGTEPDAPPLQPHPAASLAASESPTPAPEEATVEPPRPSFWRFGREGE
jgi:hypothetical protein